MLADADQPALGREGFDVVLFDEASQIPPWDAVGAIARGDQVIVVGDSRQLPPTGFFSVGDSEVDELDDESLQEMESILDEGRVVYGINTGFGALASERVAADDLARLQRNLIVSHCVGVGEPFDAATTRAILLIRANTLAKGFSGIRVSVVERFLDLLNADFLPLVPRQGSVGASGDLAPLAHLAAPLIGEAYKSTIGRHFPSMTLVQVVGLVDREALVEIECIAVVPD